MSSCVKVANFSYLQNDSIRNTTEACHGKSEWTDELFLSVQTRILLIVFVNGPICLITLIGNSLVIIAVAFTRKLQVATNFYIVSLSVADLIIGMIAGTFHIFSTLHGHPLVTENYGNCLFYWITLISIFCASVFNLLALSIDRYIAVMKPLHYHNIMTWKARTGLLVLVWLMSCVFGSVHLFGLCYPQKFLKTGECSVMDIFDHYSVGHFFITPVFISLLCILVMYGLVFRAARRQTQRISAVQPMMTTEQRKQNVFLGTLKAVKTLSIILGCLLICWIPMILIMWLTIITETILLDAKTFYALVYMLPFTNSAVNPIVYAYRDKVFRKTFRSIFCKICGKEGRDNNISVSRHSSRASRNTVGHISQIELSTISSRVNL
ncbi:adenosine receptor A2b-like [Branchiostoma lanceolatum]|uniref:adenosine receptor A2b-like n=1 Tax=Branchiostoma lanceolatum TaxID=7740 RepID=UPI00345170CC